MSGVITSAASILSQSTRRIEIAGQNIANVTTPGYKRQVYFNQLISDSNIAPMEAVQASVISDLSKGKLQNTGRSYDLALQGEGYFVVRSPNGETLLTRAGQFTRDAAGRLATASGAVLQADGGGDLLLHSSAMVLSEDGTVLEEGAPTARLAIATPGDVPSAIHSLDGTYLAVDGQTAPVAHPSVKQGALETSNVSNGTEMMTIMEAMRRAEAAQRLVTVYDDLLGRALQSFGQV